MAVHGSIRCSSCVCARGWNWSTGRVGVTGNASLFLRSIDAGRSFGAHRFPLRLEAHTRYGTVRYGTVRYRPAGSLLCVSATLSLRPGIPCSEEVRGGLFLPRATPRRAAPALMDPPPWARTPSSVCMALYMDPALGLPHPVAQVRLALNGLNILNTPPPALLPSLAQPYEVGMVAERNVKCPPSCAACHTWLSLVTLGSIVISRYKRVP